MGRGLATLVIGAITLFAVGGAAFTAANTTPNSSAGEDLAATISGFTISGITYNLNAADPSSIDSVVFTAQSDHAGPWPAALGTKLGRFTSTAAEWNVCADDAGGAAAGTYVITCTTVPAGLFYFYDGTTLVTQLTVTTAVEFDTILVQ
jgi:hypothetical protein